jgi:hypothetical protein
LLQNIVHGSFSSRGRLWSVKKSLIAAIVTIAADSSKNNVKGCSWISAQYGSAATYQRNRWSDHRLLHRSTQQQQHHQLHIDLQELLVHNY